MMLLALIGLVVVQLASDSWHGNTFNECLSHFQDYCYLVSLLGLLCLLIEPAEGTITLPHFHNQQRSQHNKKLEPLDGRSEVGEGDGFCIQLGNVRWGFALPLMICL